jgi:hypothetical protein
MLAVSFAGPVAAGPFDDAATAALKVRFYASKAPRHESGGASWAGGIQMEQVVAFVVFFSALIGVVCLIRWDPAATIDKAIASLKGKPIMKLGHLTWPFVAGAAAIVMMGVLFSNTLFWREAQQDRIIYGLIVGMLGSVVLYAVMRALAERKA